MNVQVLGSDFEVMHGGGDTLSTIFQSVSKAFTSDTGKTVTGAVLQSIGTHMTPTQKAQYANVQGALGLPQMPVTNATPMPYPYQQEKPNYTPYYIIGGAVALTLILMVATRK